MRNQQATTLRRAMLWLTDQVVQDVSDEMARCEFGCSKLDCSQGEWETCSRRLQEAEDLKRWRAEQGHSLRQGQD